LNNVVIKFSQGIAYIQHVLSGLAI